MTSDVQDRIRATRPAGLAPPDLPRIRQRGRRRRLAARTTATVGVVAVLALAVGGVTRLVAPPPVDPVAPVVEDSPNGQDEIGALAAGLGMRVMHLSWSPEAFTGFAIAQSSPDGSTTASTWDRDPGPGDLPVVTRSGQLWHLGRDGRTVRFDPATGTEVTAATSVEGLGWLPLATTADGDVLVTALRLDPEPSRPERSVLRRLTVDGDVSEVPGIDAAVDADEFIGLAAASPVGLAVATFGEGTSRVVLLVDGEDPVTAMESGETGQRIVDIALVGEQLWATELDPDDGTATLHRFGLDGSPIDVAPLDLGGPVAWRMTVAPDASHVVIPVGPRAGTPTSHVVDVDAVDAGVPPADAASRFDQPGVVHLLPPGD